MKGEDFIGGRNRLGNRSSGETKGVEASGGKWVWEEDVATHG